MKNRLAGLILVWAGACPALERVHQNDVCQLVLEKLAQTRLKNNELRKGLKLAHLVFAHAIDSLGDGDYLTNMSYADRQSVTKSLFLATDHLRHTDEYVSTRDQDAVLDFHEPTVLGDVISGPMDILSFLSDVEKLTTADSGFFSTDLARLLGLAAVFGGAAGTASLSALHGAPAHLLAMVSDFAAYLAIDKVVKCYEYFRNCDEHFHKKLSGLKLKTYANHPTRWYAKWSGQLVREQLRLALYRGGALKKSGIPSRQWATEFTLLSIVRHALHRQPDFEATHFKVTLQMIIFTERLPVDAEIGPPEPQLAYFIELDPI